MEIKSFNYGSGFLHFMKVFGYIQLQDLQPVQLTYKIL